MWDLKDNIRSVILDWRRDPVGETCWSLKQTCQLPMCVLQPSHYFTKRVPRHRRKICANSLWLYSYYTQSLLSKNKNINYIFIYLRVLRCLSSGMIYVTVAMTEYSTLPKATGLEPHHHSLESSRTLVKGRSSEMQSVYSITPANLAFMFMYLSVPFSCLNNHTHWQTFWHLDSIKPLFMKLAMKGHLKSLEVKQQISSCKHW